MCSLLDRLYASSATTAGNLHCILQYTGMRGPSTLDHTPRASLDTIEIEKRVIQVISRVRDEGICSYKTGDSTCCLRDSKDYYLYT
jgi:hypothetical protein